MRELREAPSDSKFLIQYFDNLSKDQKLVVPFADAHEEEALDYQSDCERMDLDVNQDEVQLNQMVRMMIRQLDKCNSSFQFLSLETCENFEKIRKEGKLIKDEGSGLLLTAIKEKVQEILLQDPEEGSQSPVGNA